MGCAMCYFPAKPMKPGPSSSSNLPRASLMRTYTSKRSRPTCPPYRHQDSIDKCASSVVASAPSSAPTFLPAATGVVVNDGRVDTPVCEPERTVAMLQYTGGTTGTPKGAELTHANLYVNAIQVGRWFHGCEPGQERVLGVLPLFHIFGMATVMNVGLLLGAELILLPRFEIEQLMQTIHRKRPTIFPAVPTLFAAISRYEERSRYDLSSIEICVSGGAPLPAEIKDSFERLTGCVIVEGYGLTEASPVVCINPVGGRAQDRLDRPAAAAHRRSTSSRWRTAEPRSRRASAASCACVARR